MRYNYCWIRHCHSILYEWLVIPFCLCNAPTKFMCLKNDVLCPILESFVIVYLDEILVCISTQEEHISHLNKVLENLKKHELLDNLNKCEFTQQSLVYLGYVIGGGKINIYATYMQAITKWPNPTNFIEIRSFCGRNTIASFSVVVTPLHAITTSRKGFQWGNKEHQLF